MTEPTRPFPTVARVKELFDYDEENGALLWRRDRQGGARAGDEAGSITKTGHVVVGVDGVLLSAARVVYLWKYGIWPRGRLTFKDGNPANIRADNLTEKRSTYSRRKAAVYARNLRRHNEEAIELMRQRNAWDKYISADPATARRMLRDARHLVRSHDRAWLDQKDAEARAAQAVHPDDRGRSAAE